MKQEMMEWQWHQLDHMLQTGNHASISLLNFSVTVQVAQLSQRDRATHELL